MTLGEGNGTPLQYSCLENPMDGGAWKAAVHGVAEGRTRLSDFTFILVLEVFTDEKWKCCSLSRVQLFSTRWTVAHQAPLPTRYSR